MRLSGDIGAGHASFQGKETKTITVQFSRSVEESTKHDNASSKLLATVRE